MKALRLATSELRRLMSTRLLRAAFIAMMMIPTLYAGLYLYANKDPYGSLKGVPVAVVNEDRGATLSDGSRLEGGRNAVDKMFDSGAFDWQRTTREDARVGVNDGRYNFAIIIPADFSERLASAPTANPRQAVVEQITNDTNGFLSRTISDQALQTITRGVASSVSQNAAGQFLDGFADVRTQLRQASDGAGRLDDGLGRLKDGAHQLSDGAVQLRDGQGRLLDGATRLDDGLGTAADGARQLKDGSGQLATGATTLADGLGELDRRTAELPSQTRRLADGAKQVSDGNAKLAGIATTVDGVASDLDAIREEKIAGLRAVQREVSRTDPALGRRLDGEIDRLDKELKGARRTVGTQVGQINRLSDGAAQVADGAQRLADASGQLRGGITRAADGGQRLADGARDLSDGATRLDGGLGQLKDGSGQLKAGLGTARDGSNRLVDGLDQAKGGIDQAKNGAGQLATGLGQGIDKLPALTPQERQVAAETIGNPVGIEEQADLQAANYGAGMAPYFMCLGLWVGAYALFQIARAFSPRALVANAPAWAVQLCGWVAPAAAAVLQASVTLLVVKYVVGLTIERPWATWGMFVLAGLTFAAIVQVMLVIFGNAGKLLALVLLVLQLAVSGGTFPWQTLPEPMQIAHKLVPMSYALDGMRRGMYGGSLHSMSGDAAMLVFFLVGALFVGWLSMRRNRMWTVRRVQPDMPQA